jgi:hypothetical protein
MCRPTWPNCCRRHRSDARWAACGVSIETIARFEPRRGPGNALRAIVIGSESAQLFEHFDCGFGISGHQRPPAVRHDDAACGESFARGQARLQRHHRVPAPCRAQLHRGSTLDGKAFKSVVVVVGVLRCRGDNAAIFCVIDDQVGVRPNGDRSFARKEAEELCGRVLSASTKRCMSRPPRLTP